MTFTWHRLVHWHSTWNADKKKVENRFTISTVAMNFVDAFQLNYDLGHSLALLNLDQIATISIKEGNLFWAF